MTLHISYFCNQQFFEIIIYLFHLFIGSLDQWRLNRRNGSIGLNKDRRLTFGKILRAKITAQSPLINVAQAAQKINYPWWFNFHPYLMDCQTISYLESTARMAQVDYTLQNLAMNDGDTSI